MLFCIAFWSTNWKSRLTGTRGNGECSHSQFKISYLIRNKTLNFVVKDFGLPLDIYHPIICTKIHYYSHVTNTTKDILLKRWYQKNGATRWTQWKRSNTNMLLCTLAISIGTLKGRKHTFHLLDLLRKAKQSNFMNWTLQIRYNLARLAPKNHDFADYMIKEISTPRSTIDFR